MATFSPIGAADLDAFTAVAALIEPGARLVTARDLTGGVATRMTLLVLETELGASRSVIVRRPDDPTSRGLTIGAEYRLLVELSAGVLPVPRPVVLDESGAILPEPYVVLDHIDGQARFVAADPIELAESMAAHLAAIHRIDGANPALRELPRRAAEIAGHLAAPADRLDDSVHEGRVRAALATFGPSWPPSEPEPTCLLHGDFWPGNVLWSGDVIAGIIDWEDAGVGDPLSDVGITRLDLMWVFGPEAMEAFTARYAELTSRDVALLPRWDLVAALRPAGALSLWAPGYHAAGRPDITTATMRAGLEWFVERALAASLS